MPGTKRKASFAFPYERPVKLSKRSTSTTVSRVTSIVKSPSVMGGKFTPLKFPSLRATKSATKEVALSSLESSGSEVVTPPSLRRASTLTLEDNEEKGGSSSGLSSKRQSSKTSRTPSLTKKSSNVEEGALVTRLSGLRSGSVVGETSATEPGPSSASASSLSPKKSLTKKLSSRKSSVGKGVPSVPSGLTKLALTKSGTSLNVSKDGLIANVDEAEVDDALASLKSHLSKEKSKTSADDAEEAMDDGGPGTSGEPVMPPGGFLDIAISFDTTGSMMGCLNEVKAKVQSLVQRLQADIPGIHIAIIAHGDYCDADKYIVKWIDFGASLPEICDFVTNVGPTFGGDGPECYELVLLRARGVLSWRPGSQRVLIMIGDDVPHEPGYTYGGKTYNINWRDECRDLKNMGVKVYGVQAGGAFGASAGVENFHREMARLTDGRHLKLDKFESCFDFLMMICYREGNPDMLQTYEEEMRARDGRLNKDVSFCMAALTGAAPKVAKKLSFKKATKATKKSPMKVVKAAKKTEKASPKKKPVAGAKKATKVASAKKKAVLKKKKPDLKVNRALKRENLPDATLSKGPLKQFKWSNWVCAITPKLAGESKKAKPSGKKGAAKKTEKSSEYAICKHYPGYRLKSIFNDERTTPAIYEIAVQCGESRTSKKRVVYYRRSRGWVQKKRWDLYLLRHETVRAEVNKAIASGFSIWIRRGVPMGRKGTQLNRLNKAYEYLRDTFDYAWKKYVWRRIGGRQYHRQVKVNSKGTKNAVISHSDI